MNSELNESDIKLKFEEIFSFKNNEEVIEFREAALHLRIIDELIAVLETRNWNQAKLANELGTSKSYITQLFNGNKLINLKLLAKLEKILNIEFRVECHIKPEIVPAKSNKKFMTAKNVTSKKGIMKHSSLRSKQATF